MKYKDSVPVCTSRSKDAHEWRVETMTLCYSATTPITAQALMRRTGGRREASGIAGEGDFGHGEECTRLEKTALAVERSIKWVWDYAPPVDGYTSSLRRYQPYENQIITPIPLRAQGKAKF